jgi:hypothetical protein
MTPSLEVWLFTARSLPFEYRKMAGTGAFRANRKYVKVPSSQMAVGVNSSRALTA